MTLNQSLLKELLKLQHEIRHQSSEANVMSVNELLRWPGMIEDVAPDQETLQQQVKQAMDDTLKTFTSEREREGAALTKALVERVHAMQEIVTRIEPLIPQLVAQFQKKAVERMQEALGMAIADNANASQTQQEASERIRQEVTLYGMRIDVAEELARLKIHLEETKNILEKGGLVGKRMDFMLQELNREAQYTGLESGHQGIVQCVNGSEIADRTDSGAGTESGIKGLNRKKTGCTFWVSPVFSLILIVWWRLFQLVPFHAEILLPGDFIQLRVPFGRCKPVCQAIFLLLCRWKRQ